MALLGASDGTLLENDQDWTPTQQAQYGRSHGLSKSIGGCADVGAFVFKRNTLQQQGSIEKQGNIVTQRSSSLHPRNSRLRDTFGIKTNTTKADSFKSRATEPDDKHHLAGRPQSAKEFNPM